MTTTITSTSTSTITVTATILPPGLPSSTPPPSMSVLGFSVSFPGGHDSPFTTAFAMSLVIGALALCFVFASGGYAIVSNWARFRWPEPGKYSPMSMEDAWVLRHDQKPTTQASSTTAATSSSAPASSSSALASSSSSSLAFSSSSAPAPPSSQASAAPPSIHALLPPPAVHPSPPQPTQRPSSLRLPKGAYVSPSAPGP